MIGGFILLILPGIYFMLRFVFVPVLIVDKNLTIKEAFARSTQLTQGIKLKLFWFGILAGLINALGMLLLGIGILVTIPLTALAGVYIYRHRFAAPAVV